MFFLKYYQLFVLNVVAGFIEGLVPFRTYW